MKLSHRIFLGYFLVIAIAGVFLLKSMRDELRPAVRQSMEESMVDTANLLAEIVEKDVRNNTLSGGNFAAAVDDFLARRPAARIWGLSKNRTSYRIYVTNHKGIVLYDSDGGRAVGADYSQWNDVYLTLRGEYGARSTKADPDDDTSSVMYIAAPIKDGDRIIGVLTVSKPNISVLPFIQLSQRNIAQAAFLLLIVALILGWVFAGFLSRSTRQLATYANQVRDGQKASLPRISEPELSQLGQAIESMRTALEGKEYVEHYVHSLTHEIKSPLSGIAGACELLAEDMSPADRARFIGNIKTDARRLQGIVDRLLDLARLEQQQALEQTDALELKAIVHSVAEAQATAMAQKSLTCKTTIAPSPSLRGDNFLIRQAINNILENAMDFSPEGGEILINGEAVAGEYILSVKDQGPGVPDYAQEKIFDRFYSLPRPQTGQKSSGLGLSFVREIMKLHHGDVRITSDASGCRVQLIFPTG